MKDKKYIILEIIPTRIKNGDIAQLSALKLNNLNLEDRFDYRLDEQKINNIDLINMIQYDKEMFTYVNSTRKIMMRFKKWIGDYDLLIIDNLYTENYLKNIKNKKESIFKYLNMVYSDDIIEKIMDKYRLESSNHIVDLLYEALIIESNVHENWNLVLEENFDDLKNWNYDVGSGIKGLWGNNEKEFYTNRNYNSYVKDNKLYIISRKEKYEDCNYTSARLVTRDKIHFKYGYIEIRAKLPSGKGSWPAIWMLGVNDKWPIGGEIDIIEHLGKSENKIYHTIHSKNHICKPYNSFSENINDVCTEFHNYGLHWEEDLIEFYVDRNLTGRIIKNKNYKSKEDWPFNDFFYLIINCAVGGDWPGEIDDTSLPYTFTIEYVKVWQKDNHKIDYV